MSKLASIIEGWSNHLTGDTNSSRVAYNRSVHCAVCVHAVKSGEVIARLVGGDQIKEIQGYKCNLCNCPLSTKLRSLQASCPAQKWGPINKPHVTTSSDSNSNYQG
jgi:hypothetical protein